MNPKLWRVPFLWPGGTVLCIGSYHAWFSLKVVAKKLGKSLYEVKHNLWSDYLRNELRNPRIPAYRPA